MKDGKFVPVLKHNAKNADKGHGSKAPDIPDLGTRWRRVVSYTLGPLYTRGKSP